MNSPTARRLLGLAMLISSLASLLTACGDDLLDTSDYELGSVTATPDISLPLAYGELALGDLLEDTTYIRVDADGLIYVTYEDTQEILDIREFMFFPDRTFDEQLPIPPTTYPPATQEVERLSINTSQDFSFPQLLTEIAFDEATSLELSLSFDQPGTYDFLEAEITLPTFTKNGVALTARADVSQPVVISLAGYIAQLNDNVFPLNITLIEKPHTAQEETTVLTEATVSVGFQSFDFDYIQGFFGEMGPFGISEQTIEMDAFGDALGEAKVSFADPQLTFSVISDFGLPVTIDFNPLEARNQAGDVLPIEFTVPNPVQIQAPVELGETATTDIGIANLGALFDFSPDEMAYGLSIGANQGMTSGVNFMHDTSKLRVLTHAELPLYGKASNILLRDTFELDLSGAEETQIESAALRIRCVNELPLDAFLQIYFANENSIISDSLFADGFTNLIKASTVTAAGELDQAGSVDNTIALNEGKLKRLFEAKRLIVKASLNTTTETSGVQNHVQFKSDYTINLNLGFQAKLKLESEL